MNPSGVTNQPLANPSTSNGTNSKKASSCNSLSGASLTSCLQQQRTTGNTNLNSQ
jgi:hypothetical protein